MNYKPIFISGIGTGVGKTVTSAVIVENLQADYWKPIQSGDLDFTDTDRVRSLITNSRTNFHPESYRLTQPFSPHKSAALDHIKIEMGAIKLPQTNNRLVIEGAGGLLVPLNDNELMIDLIKKFEAEVVLVSQNYLGSINHTLMSLEILEKRGFKLNTLVICGDRNESSEEVIAKWAGLKITYIPLFDLLNKAAIKEFADTLIL